MSEPEPVSMPATEAMGKGPSEHVERRLAAILAADVVGYSRLMGLDEEGTLERLKEHRRVLFDPKIVEHRGRIVKTTGDGLLVEFASVVDAVRCAVEVQRGMAERNEETPAERRIQFRIGINLGDIIIDGDDIYGDGVNVAARIEGLADPGGIYVSRVVRDQVRDKLDFFFEDMGAKSVKNIARPVLVDRVQISGMSSGAKGAVAGDKAAAVRVSLRQYLRIAARVAWKIIRVVLILLVVLVVLYRWVMPPATTTMLLRFPQTGKMERRTVPLAAISPDVPRALIAAEDHRFCLHRGVDWDAETDSGRNALLGSVDSITMQLAGSLFLWPGNGFVHKGLEIGLAYAIDAIWPKRRILEVYLNVADWGTGVYGVEAAAQAFYRKNAARLTRTEAAQLVAALANPRQLSPARPTQALSDRTTAIAKKIDQRQGNYTCIQ